MNQNTTVANAVEGIAIIGMSGRFPRARNLEEYWGNVRDGRECITFFSDEQLLAAGVDPALVADPSYVKAGGVLDDIDLFDAGFFGLNPREAEVMDPQQRLFLECTWNALEDAGVAPHTYPGLIGVFAGAGNSTYLWRIYSHPELVALVGNFQIVIANDKDHLTTQASYKFNLRGPSVAVQTACSSSLVATAMACQSLADYQCDIALAGGVLINVPQTEGRYYRPGGVVSPDGHCRAFDAAAQGTVGGNGVGVVALKRLSEALADGDHIHAIIRGWATNNDGSLKVGYTAPSVEGQAEVIAMAQAMAGVDPQTITYVEAHGTGTALGDPIEVAALTQAFRAGTAANAFCALGSVKTNIGHLDPAAGVAGLIKTVLALQHRTLPPSLHFRDPNPAIDFANSPFYVPRAATTWPAGPTPRRAGVSSFGIGGTNAHVVLEEAPALRPAEPSRAWQLLVLSARSAAALDVATANLAAHLQREPALSLPDVAFTLQVGRRPFSHRRVLVCRDLTDAVQALTVPDPQRVLSGIVDQTAPVVAFMFTGQGAQYVAMARDLYLAEPIFRRQIDYCAEYLYPHLSLDLRDLLYPRAVQAAEAAEGLKQTAITQPALFAIEYALARLWMAWGVQPAAMIGHSIGEYVAACLAGVFTPEDALQLVAARGRLMQQLPAGAMLAISLSRPTCSRGWTATWRWPR